MAAQSIGEPGTQLTMRTFHTGGVRASVPLQRDITQRSAARREELFEARTPKGKAILSEIDGVVEVRRTLEDAPIIVVVIVARSTTTSTRSPGSYEPTGQGG